MNDVSQKAEGQLKVNSMKWRNTDRKNKEREQKKKENAELSRIC
uniref:Nexilin n=1 Tax=Mus musculus TaxID=10090 RepID=A0A0G2JDZ7_MOUSE